MQTFQIQKFISKYIEKYLKVFEFAGSFELL